MAHQLSQQQHQQHQYQLQQQATQAAQQQAHHHQQTQAHQHQQQQAQPQQPGGQPGQPGQQDHFQYPLASPISPNFARLNTGSPVMVPQQQQQHPHAHPHPQYHPHHQQPHSQQVTQQSRQSHQPSVHMDAPGQPQHHPHGLVQGGNHPGPSNSGMSAPAGLNFSRTPGVDLSNTSLTNVLQQPGGQISAAQLADIIGKSGILAGSPNPNGLLQNILNLPPGSINQALASLGVTHLNGNGGGSTPSSKAGSIPPPSNRSGSHGHSPSPHEQFAAGPSHHGQLMSYQQQQQQQQQPRPMGQVAPQQQVQQMNPLPSYLTATTLPPGPGTSNIYTAVYSGIQVYEMMIRGIAVMKRRSDNHLNATQILKVAGIEKGKRTKILEKEILTGRHEKVQGGYGKYQGTWIPYQRGRELSEQYGVAHLLTPLFEFTSNAVVKTVVSSKDPHKESIRKAAPAVPAAEIKGSSAGNGAMSHAEVSQSPVRMTNEETSQISGNAPASIKAPGPRAAGEDAAMQAGNAALTKKKPRGRPVVPETRAPPPSLVPRPVNPGMTLSMSDDGQKDALMSIFLHEDPSTLPDLGSALQGQGLDVNIAIDEQGHTALHWAAALAKIDIAKLLVDRGADIFRGNASGESPLVRATLVTNAREAQTFPQLLSLLAPSIACTDPQGRTLLHHIALTAGIRGRASTCRYYAEHVLEHIARHLGGQFEQIINVQDINGDTAVNIAARVGNKSIVKMLIAAGANRLISNKIGLSPIDFGVTEEEYGPISASDANLAVLVLQHNKGKGSEKSFDSHAIMAGVNALISSLGSDFEKEVSQKQSSLDQVRGSLRSATKDLAECRKQTQIWRDKIGELQEAEQKSRNLQMALDEEDRVDWCRCEIYPHRLAGSPSKGDGDVGSDPPNGDSMAIDDDYRAASGDLEADPLPPGGNGPAELLQLRRMAIFYKRTLKFSVNRLQELQRADEERELHCRRLVAKCCEVREEEVDGMLENLVAAVEADGQEADVSRIANFLHKTRE